MYKPRRPTNRQREVLRFIHRHTTEHGYSPTHREIGDATGISSTNGVNDHLTCLEKKGCLVREPFTARALVITERGCAELGVMPARPDKLRLEATLSDDDILTVQLSPQAADILEQLRRIGLYGDTAEDVARNLLYERMRQEIEKLRSA